MESRVYGGQNDLDKSRGLYHRGLHAAKCVRLPFPRPCIYNTTDGAQRHRLIR